EGFPESSSFWPDSIATPNTNTQWFRSFPGSASTCNEGVIPPPGTIPVGSPLSGRLSDEKVMNGSYARGKYAQVHRWEAKLNLFARVTKNEDLRNSRAAYQNFYLQTDAEPTGDYARIRDQLAALFELEEEDALYTDELGTELRMNFEQLLQASAAYSQATTEAERNSLEAAWLQHYNAVNNTFVEWQTLTGDAYQNVLSEAPQLQLTNAALPERNELFPSGQQAGGFPSSGGSFVEQVGSEHSTGLLAPAANEKLMNTIQLKRTVGEPLTEQQGEALVTLAFSCPLEAGNAVYRARTLLRTQGPYVVFDDLTLCQNGGETEGWSRKSIATSNDTSVPAPQWIIYPNPAKDQLWIAGDQLEALENIQLFDGLGIPVLRQANPSKKRVEIQLPTGLPTGLYFLRLQLRDGQVQTHKIFIQS
ncbi:MAG: T9SS type A sorting domain-containing protein, partial [Bacteroidota bacterium]